MTHCGIYISDGVTVAQGEDLQGEYVRYSYGRFQDTYHRLPSGHWGFATHRVWTERFQPGMPRDSKALDELNKLGRQLHRRVP